MTVKRGKWTLGLCGLIGLSCGAGTQPGPSSQTQSQDNHACNEIGCENGLRIELQRSSAWEPGAYRVQLVVDGEKHTCQGKLPLADCDAGNSFSCDHEGLSVLESGCALPQAQHGIAGLDLQSTTARKVTLTIERDGVLLATSTIQPNYVEQQPNGPNCGPVCKNAGFNLKLK